MEIASGEKRPGLARRLKGLESKYPLQLECSGWGWPISGAAIKSASEAPSGEHDPHVSRWLTENAREYALNVRQFATRQIVRLAGEPFDDPQLAQVAERVMRARCNGAPVILMMGAHIVKVGLSRFAIDLMERRIVTHVGMNGAGPIHDFELASVGGSTESVSRYIQAGQFGLWQETGRIYDAVAAAVTRPACSHSVIFWSSASRRKSSGQALRAS